MSYIPPTHNYVQSHNSDFHVTSLIKDSGSLHSALVVKTELFGKNRFLNETYLINYIKCQYFTHLNTTLYFFTIQALNIDQKISSCWCLVL